MRYERERPGELVHVDVKKIARMPNCGGRGACNMLKIPPVLSFGTCTDTGRISMLVTALADHLNVDIPDLPIEVPCL